MPREEDEAVKAPRKAKFRPRRPEAKKKSKSTKRSKALRVARGRGQPSKFTSEITQQIIEFLEIGNYKADAARAAGVSPSSLYEWLAIGAAPNARKEARKYYEFAEAVKKAQATARARMVHAIASAVETQWQAAAWYLERTRPQQWGRMDRQPRAPAGAQDGSAQAGAANGVVRVEVVYTTEPAPGDGASEPGDHAMHEPPADASRNESAPATPTNLTKEET